MKKFTVFCFCCCGCDANEIHWVESRSPSAATRKKLFDNKRVVAVINGHHPEVRKNAE